MFKILISMITLVTKCVCVLIIIGSKFLGISIMQVLN